MNTTPYILSCVPWMLALTLSVTVGCGGDELAQQVSNADTSQADMMPSIQEDASQDLALDQADGAPDEPGDMAHSIDMQPDLIDEPDQSAMLGKTRCESKSLRVTCVYNTTEIDADGLGRDVHWQVPSGTPPSTGWPVVFFFQGSLFSAGLSWDNLKNTPYGAYELTRTIKALLDRGYAVIAPEASFGGSTFWDTNVWPYNNNWEISNDHELMLALFAHLEEGTFGPLDPETLFATGISSGGYMTSRMAIAYPGKFKALAIASASYATCSGPLCLVPDSDDLPTDHPPTLFLHGSIDATVPIYTMRDYAGELDDAGIPTEQVVETLAGHEWLGSAVTSVPEWFDAYR